MHSSCAKWHYAFNSFIRLTVPALIIFCHVVREIFILLTVYKRGPWHFSLFHIALIFFFFSVNIKPQAKLKTRGVSGNKKCQKKKEIRKARIHFIIKPILLMCRVTIFLLRLVCDYFHFVCFIIAPFHLFTEWEKKHSKQRNSDYNSLT